MFSNLDEKKSIEPLPKLSVRLQVNPNISALIREQIEFLLERKVNRNRSMYDRTAHLCGIIKGGPRDMALSREYLKQYGKKRGH
jgi:hypothetical protein